MTSWGMFEISISPRSQWLVPNTRYDAAAGFRFDSRDRAEQYCRELNHFCYQERFLVIRVVGPQHRQPSAPPLRHAVKAAA